jgi:hypothetical protein
VMKKIYLQIVTSINPMHMDVKFEIYYQILNLYITLFTNMQHEICLKMRNEHNYSIASILKSTTQPTSKSIKVFHIEFGK